MKKSILLFLLLLATGGVILAQNKSTTSATGGMPGYKTGIGGRFGFEGGLTVKHFLKPHRAIEGILSTHWGYGGFRLTGLYEVHKHLGDVEGLDWFFGAGAHIGSYSARYYGYYGYYNNGYYDKHGNWHANGYRSRYMTIGLDGIIGLEYQFEELPFSAALDFKPYFDFIGGSNRFGDLALSLRYTIK